MQVRFTEFDVVRTLLCLDLKHRSTWTTYRLVVPSARPWIGKDTRDLLKSALKSGLDVSTRRMWARPPPLGAGIGAPAIYRTRCEAVSAYRQAQRRNPAGLSHRCARPHRRVAAHPYARVTALELDSRPSPDPGRVVALSPHAAASSNLRNPWERASRPALATGKLRRTARRGARSSRACTASCSGRGARWCSPAISSWPRSGPVRVSRGEPQGHHHHRRHVPHGRQDLTREDARTGRHRWAH